MIFVYDLLVNYNDEAYKFYEWDVNDEIEYLKRSVLIKVSDYLYKKVISKNIIVGETFLASIKEKSEIVKEKKHEKMSYMCIFTNGSDTTGVTFNNNGRIMEFTKFTLQDELELLDIALSLKIKKIDYKEITNNEYSVSFITRDGKKVIKMILRELNMIKDEKDKINYLYYEWFNKKCEIDTPYNELVRDIKSFYGEGHTKFLKLLNIISIKNNV